MKISVFGLGYVGCVSIGCLAENGHTVIGVDPNEFKVAQISKGEATILEAGIDEILKNNFKKGLITATTSARDAVMGSDLSFICVGTPSTSQGHTDLSYIFNTAEQIGAALKEKNSFHTIVIRSTVVPGTNEKFASLVEKISGRKKDVDFSVISNPEFLREGSAVKDYFHPSVTVIGGSSDYGVQQVASLYSHLNAPIEKTSVKVAELIKYINNSFHALKIAFANEVGNICKSLSIDSHEVMELFCKDNKLNISPAYFRPGNAFGGSCLPKDLKGLVALGHDNYVSTPVLTSIETSNDHQKRKAYEMVEATGKKNICFIGLSFKEGTDDLRYSPFVELAETLIGKGFNITIYDDNVRLSGLIGANKAYVNERLPHLSKLIASSLDQAIENNEVIVVNNRLFDIVPYVEMLNSKHSVIDLVRVNNTHLLNNYKGLSW